jgi:hypothetical protein
MTDTDPASRPIAARAAARPPRATVTVAWFPFRVASIRTVSGRSTR